jgi:hypothetical protein
LVELVQAAVTTESSVEIVVAGGLGQSEVIRNGAASFDGQRIKVEGRCLDDLLDGFAEPTKVALVWADVQGCELGGAHHGRLALGAGVPCWIEVSPGIVGPAGTAEFIDAAREQFTGFVSEDRLLKDAFAGPVSLDGLTAHLAGVKRHANIPLA